MARPWPREGADWAYAELEAFGALTGSAKSLELGRLANENPPRLKTFDPQGRRLERVEYHPAYPSLHELFTSVLESM